jgi:non-specific serine/threonine protein kinase
LEKFPDGIWLVGLASQRDPALVPRAVASTIGLRDQPQRSTIDMLCDHLQQREMLIILDNCEHLVETCAFLAEKILQSSPGVRILATSREKLGIHGEVIYQVPSLSLPRVRRRLPITSLQKYEAVELFLERATVAVPGFTVSNENAAILVQICQRLDGIPLIIELAAAKLRVLSLEQIYERLDDRFQLLASGVRTALPRHQTLQAVIDWSYDLLSTPEQILFQRLSVFSNGWTLEAAEFVCSDKILGPSDILELLEQLINKSLVHKEETVNEPRYRMLDTIREYALQKLDSSGEMKEVCFRHLLFFANMVEEAERNFKGPNQAIWYSYLEKDLDNIRLAMTWFHGQEYAEIRLLRRPACAAPPSPLLCRPQGYATRAPNSFRNFSMNGSMSPFMTRCTSPTLSSVR